MPWALVFFLLPLVLFAVVARRVIRLGMQLRDPERLRELFSDDVRAALVDAGFDPDSVSMEDIQKSEDLTRLVAADLRRVLQSLVFGLRSPRPGPRPAMPPLPTPIDPSSGPGVRAVLIAVIIGVMVVATFLTVFAP